MTARAGIARRRSVTGNPVSSQVSRVAGLLQGLGRCLCGFGKEIFACPETDDNKKQLFLVTTETVLQLVVNAVEKRRDLVERMEVRTVFIHILRSSGFYKKSVLVLTM